MPSGGPDDGMGIFFYMLLLLIRFWPVTAVALVGAGYLSRRIARAWVRWLVLALLILLAPVLVAGEGLATGCFFGPGGERCFGVGFGLVVSFLYGVPACGILVGAGALVARLSRRGD